MNLTTEQKKNKINGCKYYLELSPIKEKVIGEAVALTAGPFESYLVASAFMIIHINYHETSSVWCEKHKSIGFVIDEANKESNYVLQTDTFDSIEEAEEFYKRNLRCNLDVANLCIMSWTDNTDTDNFQEEVVEYLAKDGWKKHPDFDYNKNIREITNTPTSEDESLNRIKYFVVCHSDIDENNVKMEDYVSIQELEKAKKEMIKYAKDHKEDETFVEVTEVLEDENGDILEEYGTELIWSYDFDEE